MVIETNFTPPPAEVGPSATPDAVAINRSARQDNEQDRERKDIVDNERETGRAQNRASQSEDRVEITPDAIELNRNGQVAEASPNPRPEPPQANAEPRATGGLQEQEPPNLTFQNLTGAPDPDDNDVERALQQNPVDAAVQQSRVITENRTERTSAADAVSQRVESQQDSTREPQAVNTDPGPAGSNPAGSARTVAVQDRAEAQAESLESERNDNANEERVERRQEPTPTAFQTEVGQNVDDLI
ncbi:MAG: hypothetical protein G3M78_02980 [Candidatus Nitrohelix vancouverensis]|uniref:Uncharacterized protein n=1 Tax=Candidatus Nitrohelix vancouverensis TaxID=2705534 RepID=A0A7T0G2J7_9BACT|nr:MAG: hypothetical protein G3M78_02980 [Candidatus Nitrohelix vancouverensis]